MSRVMRLLVAVMASALLMSGTAGASVGAKSKKVDTGKYAKTVCTTYVGVTAALDDFTTAYNGVTTSDAAAFQSESVSFASDLVDEVTRLQGKLKKQYPDIDNGKKIAKVFVTNIDDVRTGVAKARDNLQAADPSGVAFQADVAQFGAAFQVLSATLSDPFSGITDQDLLHSFGDEKSCKRVVTIFGG